MVPLPRVLSVTMAGLPRARGRALGKEAISMAKCPALSRALLAALGKDYYQKKNYLFAESYQEALGKDYFQKNKIYLFAESPPGSSR